VVVFAERVGHLGGVAGGGDDVVSGAEGRLRDVDAHPAGGASDEPSLVSHVWNLCFSS